MLRIANANKLMRSGYTAIRTSARLAQANPGHLHADQPPPPARMDTKQSRPTTEAGWDKPQAHGWSTPSTSSKGKEKEVESNQAAAQPAQPTGSTESQSSTTPSKPKSRLKARSAALQLVSNMINISLSATNKRHSPRVRLNSFDS